MEKEFEGWGIVKKEVNELPPIKYYKIRELWWCSAGENVGFEESGKGIRFLRPVLIVSSFGSNICLIVPLTSSNKIHKYRIPIGIIDGREASALISQIKVIDTRRLVEKISSLNSEEYIKIKKAVREIL